MIKSIITGMQTITPVDVSKLTIPTLIILGEHDKLVPPADSRRFYSALPHHQFVVIDNAAHLVILEQPEKVNRLIEDFLFAH